MDDTLVTCDLILGWVSDQVKQKNPIDPALWLEIALKLNALLQDEHEKLFDLEQKVAQLRNGYLNAGQTSAFAKSQIEATDEMRQAKKQKAKIQGIIETIRLAKANSRTARDVMGGQF
jgi:hypothetical protein